MGGFKFQSSFNVLSNQFYYNKKLPKNGWSNALADRMNILNNRIPLSLFEKSIDTYKKYCKKNSWTCSNCSKPTMDLYNLSLTCGL